MSYAFPALHPQAGGRTWEVWSLQRPMNSDIDLAEWTKCPAIPIAPGTGTVAPLPSLHPWLSHHEHLQLQESSCTMTDSSFNAVYYHFYYISIPH